MEIHVVVLTFIRNAIAIILFSISIMFSAQQRHCLYTPIDSVLRGQDTSSRQSETLKIIIQEID